MSVSEGLNYQIIQVIAKGMMLQNISSYDYGDEIAKHYAAYRPPLHEHILSLVLPDGSHFENGLDIGSGTGYSALALAKYCRHVSGVEPSDDMRSRAQAHAKVEYHAGSGESLPLPSASLDVVTFAGSLNYVNKAALAGELRRVCKPSALIIVYDFEILLAPLLEALQVSNTIAGQAYNHATNLSGIRGLDEIAVNTNRMSLHLSATEVAHIILSAAERYVGLDNGCSDKKLFDNLVDNIQSLIAKNRHDIDVNCNIYYAIYKIDS